MSAFEYYKELHQIPELSEKEYKTSQYIFHALEDIDYSPVLLKNTGVYADIISGCDLPWILLRADIDALPITENTGVTYTSQHEGVMHACGHDAHSAILLETARLLKDQTLPHNVRFVFQPAEEITTGAVKIIDDVIPGKLLACFALHVWPQVPSGQITTKKGSLMASSDVLKLKFYGKSSHCSQQEKGNNALLSAVDMVSAFPDINKAATNNNALLFCGSIHSGTSHNIVPEYSEIYATIRTYSTEYRENIKSEIQKAALDVAAKYGTKPDISYEGGCASVYNDEKIVDIVSNHFGVSTNANATLAGEDFSLFGKYAPSVMLWLGIGDTSPLHNEKFLVPQEVFPVGVDLWTKIASFDWRNALR